MSGPNPWDRDPIVSAAAPSGAVTVGIPRPQKPEFIPGAPGQVFDPSTGGAKDIPGYKPAPDKAQTPVQAEHDRLENEKLKRELAKTPETDPALAQSIKNLGLDELLTNVGRARAQIKTGFATGILGQLAGHFPGTPRKDFLGSLEGIKGAAILDKLQALKDTSKNGASGMGSLTEQEGERLANSIASLSPDMSADQLNQSLDIMERHAKALQAVGAGKNPQDPAVQKEYGILPLPGAEPQQPPQPRNPLTFGVDDQGPTLTPATQTRAVIDPKKQALGQKIVGLMSKGADRNTILGFAVRADPTLRNDPEFRAWVDQGISYRKKYPGAKFPIDPGFYTSEVPMSEDEQIRNERGRGALGAAIMSAGNAATARLVGPATGTQDKINQALAVANAEHPGASLAGTMAGGAVANLAGEGALGAAGMKAGLARSALSDAAYGAAAGAGNGGSAADILEGAGAGAAGGFVGNKVASGLGGVVKGVTSPAVGYVAKEEVPLTIGQAVGGKLKGIEDRLSGIPVVGDVVNARRVEGLQKMNSKAFDKALEPIGEKSGLFGEQAVADAQDKVSGAFQKALGGKVASVDRGFIVDATKAKMALEQAALAVSGRSQQQHRRRGEQLLR
jgi:hypothetical protein